MEMNRPRNRRHMVFAGVFLLALAALPALASDKVFVLIDGLPGESTDTKFPNQIDADAVSIGLSAPSSGATVVLTPITISKQVDKTTPTLASNAATKKVIKSVVITSTKTISGSSVGFLVLTLTNAIVTDWRVNDVANDSARRATEQVTFTASQITVSYAPIGADGKPGTAIKSTVP